MNYADEAIYQAIREAQRIRSVTRKKNGLQIRGSERDIIRATALTWFNNHRPKLVGVFSQADLKSVDGLYQKIVESSHRNALRSTYIVTLREISDQLVQLRSDNVVRLAAAPSTSAATTDGPPDFSPLVNDPQMKAILARRWIECTTCIAAGAPLAAAVMIGGLLEGLLLARVNRETNKRPIFTASTAPRDKQGNTLVLKEWTLQNYIDVAHELKWISETAKDIGVVLRDYRNYIHPYKELSSGVSLGNNDAALLWEIGKSIARQLLK